MTNNLDNIVVYFTKGICVHLVKRYCVRHLGTLSVQFYFYLFAQTPHSPTHFSWLCVFMCACVYTKFYITTFPILYMGVLFRLISLFILYKSKFLKMIIAFQKAGSYYGLVGFLYMKINYHSSPKSTGSL